MVVDPRRPTVVSTDLVDFEISSAPPYEAISYCWGAPTKTHHILIGHPISRPLGITKSAFDVLRTVRLLQGTKYIWIDSICINQEDTSDKLQQLPIMSDIFERASMVTAYIPDLGDALSASFFVTCLAWSYLTVREPELDVWRVQRFLRSHPERFPYRLDATGWPSLTKIVHNPIWTRAWITQETVLARRWRLVYGEVCISMGVLQMATIFVDAWDSATTGPTKSDLDGLKEKEATSCIDLFFYKGRFKKYNIEQRPSLADNILTFLSCKATMPEDKVYALLGISSDSTSLFLQQKGFMTPRQLYIQVVIQALKAGSFRTFSISGASHLRGMDLPSWVPDLSLDPPLTGTRAGHNGQYAAGSPLKAEYILSLDRNELRMRGILLEHIQVSSSTITAVRAGVPSECTLSRLALTSHDLTDPKWELACKAVFLEAASLVREYIPDIYVGGVDPFEALCRTLLQDRCPDTSGALDEPTLAKAMDALSRFFAVLSSLDDTEMLNLETASSMGNSQETDGDTLAVIVDALMYQQVAITWKGHLALVPAGTKEGDTVCIFQGAPTPCVLRPVRGTDRYIFWGEAYVQGCMQGEAMDQEKMWFTMI